MSAQPALLLLLFAILSFKVFRADAKLCEEYLAEI